MIFWMMQPAQILKTTGTTWSYRRSRLSRHIVAPSSRPSNLRVTLLYTDNPSKYGIALYTFGAALTPFVPYHHPSYLITCHTPTRPPLRPSLYSPCRLLPLTITITRLRPPYLYSPTPSLRRTLPDTSSNLHTDTPTLPLRLPPTRPLLRPAPIRHAYALLRPPTPSTWHFLSLGNTH